MGKRYARSVKISLKVEHNGQLLQLGVALNKQMAIKIGVY
jgi:hypothetical protein